jgi:hypothetical protein
MKQFARRSVHPWLNGTVLGMQRPRFSVTGAMKLHLQCGLCFSALLVPELRDWASSMESPTGCPVLPN